MSYSEIREYNGEPTIFVNDVPITPMFMLVRQCDNGDYIRNLYNAGIKVFFVYAETDWLRPGSETVPGGFEQFKQRVELILENAPEAYIVVRIVLHPPSEWADANMDELIRYSDGSIKPCTLSWGNGSEHYAGHYQMASEKWQKDASIALEDFCDRADNSPIGDRIIGYFLCAGKSCEWIYNIPVVDRDNHIFADFSPAFKKVYSRFLREKYQSEEALQRAWRIPDATFDNPLIPTIEQSAFIEKAKNLMLKAKNSESYHNLGLPYNCAVETDEYTVDMFLDVNRQQMVSDFYDAWHEGVADSLICFSKVIKKRYGKMLTGAFFGAYGCTRFYDIPTSEGTVKVLNSGVVDLLSAPGTYVNRHPGGCFTQRVMTDSLKLHNMVFVSEEDCRTHFADKLWRVFNRVYTERDSLTVLKREFARNICDGTYSWWFDMNASNSASIGYQQYYMSGKHWYMDDIFYDLFAKQQKIAELAYKYNKGKERDIAVVYSRQSLHCVSEYTSSLMIDYYRNSELSHVGTGLDFYFSDDLACENMPDYKVYLMVNLFSLTEKERVVIRKKAAKNGAMLIWLHAPGFINLDQEERITVANIQDITGMYVERVEELCVPTFRVESPLHEAVKYADVDREYGHIDREYISNFSFYDEKGPHIESSYFYIDDDSAQSLGRYTFNGKTALAMKKDEDGIVNVYCASRILRAELLMSLAEYAGCHIYDYKEDCIFDSNNFLAIHAVYTGTHTICLKEKCNPLEVYEKVYYGNETDTLVLEMRKGDTLMFSLNDDISAKLLKAEGI